MSSPPRYPEALGALLGSINRTSHVEPVELADCCGRVLAEPVQADRDLPPFNRASMDGYALRSSDVAPGRSFPVAGRIAAGHDGSLTVAAGSCVAIATGAPVPHELDAVIQHEMSDRRDPASFTIDSVAPGKNIHPRGADARRGDVVLHLGTALQPHHIGIAASVGRTSLRVNRRPRVAILTSGDEIITPDASPHPHQVRNSNGAMLIALARQMGAEVVHSQHLPDDLVTTRDSIATQLEHCDVIATVGGISAGERDCFRTAFEMCEVQCIVARALLQPGGPIYAGRHAGGCTVIGLPGNPVSVLACACLFLWPVVRKLSGLNGSLPWREVSLAEPVTPNASRQAFRPAILHADSRVSVPSWAGSGDLVHTTLTHGLLELPIQKEPVAAGTTLRFLPWPMS